VVHANGGRLRRREIHRRRDLLDLYDRPFRPELHYYVGGNSKVYGAALLRLLPGGFGEVQHPAGAAPAWPLSYDDMATAHQAGTARFGTDPSASVLDVQCKADDLDNLYVADGSFMPSIGAVNPTLTIIANALRVGDHVAERIGPTRHPQPAASPPSPCPPHEGSLAMPEIEDYALLGDLHTAALVSAAGSVDWLCLPRFDSPAAFAALLHNEEAGHWALAPAGASNCTARRYAGNTMVFETDWVTADGAVRVIDFMPPGRGRRTLSASRWA